MSLKWQPLQPGDIVDVIAPGYRTSDSEVEQAVKFLKSWQLVPRLPKKFFAKDLLCSNSDEARFEHLRSALLAKDSKAIWCMRGGYGSNRLIPQLAKVRKPSGSAKLFVGLSDITTLHVFLNQKWGWPTIHGPLLDRLGRGAALPRYEKEMKKFVFGDEDKVVFTNLKPMNALAKKRTVINGLVSGGNLIVLQSTMGTAGGWDTKGRILFFEDIGERGYRIDRVLEQFEQAGYFRRARAVIFGQFTGGNEADGRNLIAPVLKRFAEKASLPVLSGLQSGHDIIQRPVPFETKSSLVLGGSRGILTCASGAK